MTTAADWSGRVGEVWAEEWRRTERSFAGLEPALEEAILAVAPDRGRFLDIGCGVGVTTLAVARARPGAAVLGIDLSRGMIEVARTRGEDAPNASFIAGDALASVAGEAPFDLLISRHGVMFFADPVAAFAQLRGAATPRAPLVFSCFADADANPWASLITPSPARSPGYVPGPFAFADEGATRDLLCAAGWREPRARLVEYRYCAGEGDDPVADAVALFSRIGPAASVLRDAASDVRPTLLSALRTRLEHQRSGKLIDFPAAAWIWSARA